MDFADDEATRLKHEYVGTEHVLLGLIKEGHGVAAKAIQNLGVDLQKIRHAIEATIPIGPDEVSKGARRYTPRTEQAINFAIQEADDLNHNYVGTEHILLGLLRERDGVAGQILENFGLRLDGVRSEIVSLLRHGLDQ
jgi:ATP-dependent Clp protease ATP-binding subunit ClpC